MMEDQSTAKALALTRQWKEYVCGGGAALCNITLSYPLNKIIFRQMIHGVQTRLVLTQLRKEGLGVLYRGMLPPLLQKSVSMSIMFGVYFDCLKTLNEHDVNPYVARTIAGIVAGSAEAILAPFERIQTLLIHPKYNEKFTNTGQAARYIMQVYGIKEFYRGLVPILLRNGPSNVLYFMLRDFSRDKLPPRENAFYQTLQNFVAGASIGAFLSTLYYPLNVLKIAMQSELGGPHRTLVYEFNYIMRKRDFRFSNFYHGALLNISRAFMSWGIITASYEIFNKMLS